MASPAVLKLGYSLCWEDPAIDLEALQVRPGARLVTIGSAGCNALSLLLSEAASVLAVDYNPIQSALVALKAAAVEALSREDYLAFMGELDRKDRVHLFCRHVAPRVRSAEARVFWADRRDWLAAGPHRAGALERHFGTWRRLMRFVQGDARVAAMFEALAPEAQRRFFEEEWDRWIYRAVVRLFFNRASLSLAKHPDHFRYVTVSDVAGNFLGKCRHALVDLPVRDNYFLAQIFLGRYRDAAAVPEFLKAGRYDEVRHRLDRLRIATGDMASALDGLEPGSVDGFYLSNICEWLPSEGIERIFAAMTRAAAPGARATSRSLLAEREIPPERFRDRWRRLEPLSTGLRLRDRSFLYSDFAVLELTG